MILVTAATEFEMNALLAETGAVDLPFLTLVTGVGPVKTAYYLTRYLSETTHNIAGVVNFGVGGGFFHPSDQSRTPKLLDICIAEREVFGDLGVSMGETIDYLPEDLVGPIEFDLNNGLVNQAVTFVESAGIEYLQGTFITVSSVSGTRVRGDYLQKKWNGLCENMEGAAVAQVCSMFPLDLFELRCVSNMVDDRNVSEWKLEAACNKAAITTHKILQALHT
ncbi:futalosine hydrolase [Desulforhopalus sp. 52FAK]